MRNLALLPLLFSLCACMGHIRYTGPDVAPPPSAQRPVAYVTNPDLKREHAILDAASLYRLTSDAGAPNRITLEPLAAYKGCGNPLLAPVFTLGLLPAHILDTYELRYTLEGPAGKQAFAHRVRMIYSYSLWELFSVFTDDDRELGRAIRADGLSGNGALAGDEPPQQEP